MPQNRLLAIGCWLKAKSTAKKISPCGKKSGTITAEGGCATRVQSLGRVPVLNELLLGEKAMNKEEVVTTIQELAKKLGRVPTPEVN